MLIELKSATDRQATARRLEPVVRRAVDAHSVADLVEGCELLDVIEDGQAVGAVAIEMVDGVAIVKAAASRGQATSAELEAIEHICASAGVQMLGMFTRRGALVRALTERGYRIRSVELEKEIRHGRVISEKQ